MRPLKSGVTHKIMDSMLNRDLLQERLEEIEFWPELISELSFYLSKYVREKDLNLVRLLLKAGADPNPKQDLEDYLFYLYDEYVITKSTTGDIVLELMNELLKAGANPNRVWCNNYRAYDYAVENNVSPIKELLENYGADKMLRKYM